MPKSRQRSLRKPNERLRMLKMAKKKKIRATKERMQKILRKLNALVLVHGDAEQLTERKARRLKWSVRTYKKLITDILSGKLNAKNTYGCITSDIVWTLERALAKIGLDYNKGTIKIISLKDGTEFV